MTPQPSKRAFGGPQPGSGRPPKEGVKTSIFVSLDANEAWNKISTKLGITKTAVIEMALRDYAEKNSIPVGESK